MGYIFEELIRRFNEASNEEAGDHFTPREVIRLMVNLLFVPDGDMLTTKGIVKTLYDPACGTGGMLSVSEEYLRELNPDARLEVFGQDYNAAVLRHLRLGHDDQGPEHRQHRLRRQLHRRPLRRHRSSTTCWPIRPSAWSGSRRRRPSARSTRSRASAAGSAPGLPRINDGSFLFLQHMITKMKDPKEGGTRLAIVFNGSPLFTGIAGSGESEIRRWIIENDWLEAIVALPDQLFYNTGISTYIWIVTNRKEQRPPGQDPAGRRARAFSRRCARAWATSGTRSAKTSATEITRLYGSTSRKASTSASSTTADFGYRRITVERPLRLNFAVTPERLARVEADRALRAALAASKKRKDTKAAQAEIADGQEAPGSDIWRRSGRSPLRAWSRTGRSSRRLVTGGLSRRPALKVPAPLFKAILAALSERDETADVCTDAEGQSRTRSRAAGLRKRAAEGGRGRIHAAGSPAPRARRLGGRVEDQGRLRDQLQPLLLQVHAAAPLEEIEADLKKIEQEIADMLTEVTE